MRTKIAGIAIENMRQKYNTKFRALTLAVDKEPFELIKEAMDEEWHVMKLYTFLQRVATKNKLPMVDRRTVYMWVDRYKQHVEKNESPHN